MVIVIGGAPVLINSMIFDRGHDSVPSRSPFCDCVFHRLAFEIDRGSGMAF
jgi:hypothetical protein